MIWCLMNRRDDTCPMALSLKKQRHINKAVVIKVRQPLELLNEEGQTSIRNEAVLAQLPQPRDRFHARKIFSGRLEDRL